MSDFIQPICDYCWKEQHPGLVPHRLRGEWREHEECCFCGRETLSGIYLRIDPREVPFPRSDK